MALSIKHKFTSAKTDGSDTALVQPSNWNDTHDLTGSTNILFGTNGSGAGGEITITAPLTLSTSALAVTVGSSGGVQAWDADLDAIAALAGTSGLLNKTAANTWALITLGTGISTFLTTPSSANFAAAITDETGSGSLVFATSPTLTTPTHTGLRETKTAPTISSGTLTVNCSNGNVFAVSLNANITTLSFSNVPASGTAYAVTLAFTADGTARTITWGTSVKWAGGTAPTLTSTSGKVDVFVLTTWDGGTTWYAFTGGQSL